MGEQWKPVPDRPGMEASTLGRVRINGEIVPQVSNGNSYVRCRSVAGNKVELVHRIVCAAFHGANWHLCVNHKDLNKQNNAPDNLEWVTYRENVAHAKSMGVTNAGERNGQCRNSRESVVEAYKLVCGGMTREQAAEQTGATLASVAAACRGSKWKVLGLRPVRGKNVRRITPEQRMQVEKLWREGRRLDDIVAETGAPKTTAWRITKSLEMSHA